MPSHSHDHPANEREPYSNVTLTEFMDALAARQSTPGGGGASALAGAAAAGLVSMVARFTIGKAQFAAVEERVRDILARADSARAALLFSIDDDANAFEALMTAYAVPRTADAAAARQRQINARLRDATNVPHMVARTCADVADMGRELAEIGNPNTISDAAGAALLAASAVEAVLYNARLNLTSLAKAPSDDDRLYISATKGALTVLEDRARATATAVRTAMQSRFA